MARGAGAELPVACPSVGGSPPCQPAGLRPSRRPWNLCILRSKQDLRLGRRGCHGHWGSLWRQHVGLPLARRRTARRPVRQPAKRPQQPVSQCRLPDGWSWRSVAHRPIETEAALRWRQCPHQSSAGALLSGVAWPRLWTEPRCGRNFGSTIGRAWNEPEIQMTDQPHSDRTLYEKTSCLLSLGRQKTIHVPIKICGSSIEFQ